MRLSWEVLANRFGEQAFVFQIIEGINPFVEGFELAEHFTEDKTKCKNVYFFVIRFVLFLFGTEVSASSNLSSKERLRDRSDDIVEGFLDFP